MNKTPPKTYTRFPRLGSKTSSPQKQVRRSLAQQSPDKSLSAQAFGIYNASTLEPLIQYNTAQKREIASLTKMMTLLVCMRMCKKFRINIEKAYFRVTPNAAATRGTTADLQSREWVTVQDLFFGMMLPSGNDAATCLSENFGAFIYYDRVGEAAMLNDIKSLDLTDDTWNIKIYTQQFVKYMNNAAKEIGMKETNFINPTGLDSSYRLESYSVVEDLAILTKALLEYPQCLRIIATEEYTAELKTIREKEVIVRKVQWSNTNKLLGESGCLGGKTGVTGNAGNCLASIYERKGVKYIVVILGCSTKQSRFKQTKSLVDKYII